MIPKIIHQMWVQGFQSMPENYQQWSNKWKEHHPDWRLMFWDDMSARRMLEKNYPHYVDMYDDLIVVKKTDFFRLILLHHFGGVWVDTDTYPIRTLESLIQDFNLECYDMTVSYENDWSFIWKSEVLKKLNSDKDLDDKYKNHPPLRKLVVGSAFLMFKPNQQFLIEFIEHVKLRTDMPVLEHYSTWVWTDYLADFVDDLNVKILPAKHCLVPVENKDSYMVHMYDGTWLDRTKSDSWNVI